MLEVKTIAECEELGYCVRTGIQLILTIQTVQGQTSLEGSEEEEESCKEEAPRSFTGVDCVGKRGQQEARKAGGIVLVLLTEGTMVSREITRCLRTSLVFLFLLSIVSLLSTD